MGSEAKLVDLVVVDLAKDPGFFPLRAWRLGQSLRSWFLPGRFEVDDEGHARTGRIASDGLMIVE